MSKAFRSDKNSVCPTLVFFYPSPNLQQFAKKFHLMAVIYIILTYVVLRTLELVFNQLSTCTLSVLQLRYYLLFLPFTLNDQCLHARKGQVNQKRSQNHKTKMETGTASETVEFCLLTVKSGELSAVIVRLMSKCL